MTEFSDTETRAGQIFHNFMDLMVKSEAYPDVASRVDELISVVEEECIRDFKNNPHSIVEMNWTLVVRAFREYLKGVVIDHSGIESDKVVNIEDARSLDKERKD